MTTQTTADASAVSNADLLERCELGDQRAWSMLIERYERLVYAIALREGCDLDVAADVTQETFTTLLGSLDKIDAPDRLGPWLATVARRAVWRTRHGREACEVQLVEDDLESAVDFTDEYIECASIYDAVQLLPQLCRGLILGLFFDPAEPDYATMAVRLGRPIGSIGPLRGRCLSRLRALIEQAGSTYRRRSSNA